MSAEDIRDIGEKIPRWECELWSDVSSGDGTNCPRYRSCRIRKMGGWCPADDMEPLERFLEGGRLRRFYLDRLDEREWLTCTLPGGIFRGVELLAQEYLKMGNVHSPPVPAKLISLADKQYPVEVHLLPLKAYHGSIWHLKDKWVIQLKESDTLATKRFTLFHEAFHILAHSRATPVFRKRGALEGAFNELLADYFAVCVLMPREWVKQRWSEFGDLDKMATMFVAPKPAMWIRLKSLGLI